MTIDLTKRSRVVTKEEFKTVSYYLRDQCRRTLRDKKMLSFDEHVEAAKNILGMLGMDYSKAEEKFRNSEDMWTKKDSRQKNGS